MRLGIFGGSFDPVHRGHLRLAECCFDQASLDQVWFVPTAQQPLKPFGPQAADEDRCAMLELAIAGRDEFALCRLEIERGGVSYTVDTLRAIRAERPDDELFLLIGADSLRELPQWRQAEEVFRMATPLVVGRAGEPAPDLAEVAVFCAPGVRPQRIEMPAIDISSTETRRRAAAGEAIDEMVPAEVARYIAEQGLYRQSGTQ